MIFPRADAVPRHPSQIYQALMEGLLLFLIMFLLSRSEAIRARFGLLTGIFLMGYAVARIIGEMLPRAGRIPGVPVVRRHHGTIAVDPDVVARIVAGAAPQELNTPRSWPAVLA